VRLKGYLNKKLVGESVAEFSYQPNKSGIAIGWWWCAKTSASRKGRWCCLKTLNTSSTSLTTLITALNRSWHLPMSVARENVIEQLKKEVNAMRMPIDDLLSNCAYMVMSAPAWNLKA
jgi:hypothetical protein